MDLLPPHPPVRPAPVGLLIAGLLPSLLVAACGTANAGPGHFIHAYRRAPVCEIRTDDNGDQAVDSITFDHYDKHERVAVEELDHDADGRVDVRSRFAYDDHSRLRRVESSAAGVIQIRTLEYEQDDLVRESFNDAQGRRHVRRYAQSGQSEVEPVAGEERESVTLTFDAQGRVIAEDRRMPHGAHTYSTFRYDEHGDRVDERVVQAGQPSACVVEFEHDADHRLLRQVHRLDGTDPVVTTFTWRPDGTLAASEIRAGDRLRERTDYSTACRVRRVPERH